VWLFLAGRGAGKTRTASEVIRDLVEDERIGQIAIIGETSADARDVMIEQGESSIMKTARPNFRPTYEPSKRRVTWPNGATATAYSADDPEQLRGPQHDFAWPDEVAKWRHAEETWSNMMFGLRLTGPKGDPPRVLVTTTPRPTPLLINLARGERQLDGTYIPRSDVVITHCSTYANSANLAPSFLDAVRREYEGTRLGEQELHARILDEIEGALWTMTMIDALRVTVAPKFTRVTVAVDPPAKEHGAEAGIIAMGVARGDFGSSRGVEDHGFVIDDQSRKGSPGEWARATVACYHENEADHIVAEINNGGDMVKHTIHSIDANVPVKVVHASRGKQTRAEPIGALYEQGRIHHVGSFPKLEDQQTTWVPGQPSPDRLDAMVWAATDLLIGTRPPSLPPGGAILIDL
jgi:phage terminase large subunit-like protein